MPIEPTSRFGAERLPGDNGGVPWECPQCGEAQAGAIKLGCGNCGAGQPGVVATVPQRSYEEMAGAVGQPDPPHMGPVLASSPAPRRTSLADLVVAHAAQPQLTLEGVRQVIREELAGQRRETAPVLTAQEKHALSQGVQIIQGLLAHGQIPAEDVGEFPDIDGLDRLLKQIDGWKEKL